MLGLAVTVGMLGIGGPLGHPNRIDGQQGGNSIDARMRGFGEDTEAAGSEPDKELCQRQNQRADQGHQRRSARG